MPISSELAAKVASAYWKKVRRIKRKLEKALGTPINARDVQKFLNNNPGIKASQIVATFQTTQNGPREPLTISNGLQNDSTGPQWISGPRKKRPTAHKKGLSTSFEQSLLQVKNLVDAVGSIEEAKRAMDLLEKLQK